MKKKTLFKLFLPVLFTLGGGYEGSASAEVQFSATVDQNQITLEDVISLKMTVSTDQGSSEDSLEGNPSFEAPHFEILNTSHGFSTRTGYDSRTHRMSILKQQHISQLLRPLKPGNCKISKIQIKVGHQTLQAPDIIIQVMDSGSRARKADPHQSDPFLKNKQDKGTAALNYFVRTEVDKKSAFKGEQVLMSYYLYHRVKVYNYKIEKAPILTGFLREDLVMSQRHQIESESVLVHGVPYERLLLARYAAYPFQEGTLEIDPLEIKFEFESPQRNFFDEDDDPILRLFRPMVTPKIASAKSQPLSMEVQSLPESGKPPHFTQGIGEFKVVAVMDKQEVHANEALTLTVKIEGKGNVAAIQWPKLDWLSGIEFYDSKGRSQVSLNGLGTKIFETLLIPRVPGEVLLPSLEFGFFDSVTRQYYTRKTDPIPLKVLDPPFGSALVPQTRESPKPRESQGSSDENEKSLAPTLPPLKPPISTSSSWLFHPLLCQILYGASGVLFLCFVSLVLLDWIRNRRAKNPSIQRCFSSELKKVQTFALNSIQSGTRKNVIEGYEQLISILFQAFNQTFKMPILSLNRDELHQIFLTQQERSSKLQENADVRYQDLWNRILVFFDFTDLVRFSSQAGGLSEEQMRSELMGWVQEIQKILEELNTLF